MASAFAAPTATPPPGTKRQPWSRTTRLPVRSEQGGAAVRALLEQVPVAGHLLTIDALYTTRETARLIVTTHAADYLMTEEERRPGRDRPLPGTGARAHRQRAIAVLVINYPHVAQVFRIRDGATTTEHVYEAPALGRRRQELLA